MGVHAEVHALRPSFNGAVGHVGRRFVYVHSLASHTCSGSRESGSLGKLVLVTPIFSIWELCSSPGVQSEHAWAAITGRAQCANTHLLYATEKSYKYIESAALARGRSCLQLCGSRRIYIPVHAHAYN